MGQEGKIMTQFKINAKLVNWGTTLTLYFLQHF